MSSPIYPPRNSQSSLSGVGGRSRSAKPRISLRIKLLIGSSVAFGMVFAGVFYWFYTFTTEQTLSHLRQEMRSTLTETAAGINVEELLALYATGKRNAAGFSDDPRYHSLLNWFDTVHRLQPQVWPYVYVVGPKGQNRRMGSSAAQPGTLEIIYLVDLWAAYDATKASRFLEAEPAGAAAYEVLREQRLIEEPTVYTDTWGSWLSVAMPLMDKEGNVAAILGLDVEANRIFEMQRAIRRQVLLSFLVAYVILFAFVYLLADVMTRHINALTQSAKRVGDGNYNLDLSFANQESFTDELTVLAQVFECMVDSIRTREEQIKESQKIEYEIRLALQQERELSELKSRFVSMVSHELRTPLTVIRTSIELLTQYGHLTSEEKKQDYLARCRSAIVNMNQLLEDVLTLSRAEAGRLEFNPVTTNLPRFCAALVDEVKMGIGANHIIVLQHQGDCSQACLDQALLRSILLNLLSNAAKYSPIGSEIDFSVNCTDGLVCFIIRDRGIGIPEADQLQLFDRFHRASNVSTIRGTGLGLAIVKQCVERHQGRITFSSQEGVGTAFTVELPSAQSSERDVNCGH